MKRKHSEKAGKEVRRKGGKISRNCAQVEPQTHTRFTAETHRPIVLQLLTCSSSAISVSAVKAVMGGGSMAASVPPSGFYEQAVLH